MPLGSIVRIIIDPRKVLQSRWVHDTVHRLAEALGQDGRPTPPPPPAPPSSR